jgi:PPOX class probable FMN-dependent enzyme
MKYPTWRQQLVRSFHLHRSKPEAKYFQVASVDNDHRPHLRTMVFRDFVENANSFIAITDSRSEKVEHWTHRPEAELHWYFAKSREQYRFRCQVALIQLNDKDMPVEINGHLDMSSEDARAILIKTWGNLSDSARNSFYASAPKSKIDTHSPEKEPSQQAKRNTSISEYFTLVIFKPYAADYLDLKTRPHTRQLFTLKDSHWEQQDVHP